MSIILFAFWFLMSSCCGYNTTVLTLKRMVPLSHHEFNMTEVAAFDSAQRRRLLQSPLYGAFSFPVEVSRDFGPRVYYTTLKLGTPPREFNVVIDTGSDVVWVSCVSCVGCQGFNFYDPRVSSSAAHLSCADKRCYKGSRCSPRQECLYKVEYGDGSVTSGQYTVDDLSFDTVTSNATTTYTSTPFVFGCSSLQTNSLSLANTPINGIVGLGRGRESLISQLSAQGLTPQVFSLCLGGNKFIGGTMILGQNKLPTTVYTPLVRSQKHYNVRLRTISVNGQTLAVQKSVFSLATGHGTIVDSGTTLVYFPAEAYDPLFQAISNIVSQYGSPSIYGDVQCYNITSAISSYQDVVSLFPEVRLGFAGGASMVVESKNYLFQNTHPELGVPVTCIGFRSAPSRITIIGEMALRDKMVVYDIDHQRIGWAEYNCSLDQTPQNRDIINIRQQRPNRSEGSIRMSYVPLVVGICMSFIFI